MRKADLVDQVVDAIGPGVSRTECALVVDGFLNAIKQAMVRGETIQIRRFGTFKLQQRKTRTGRNPRTGATVEVPACSVPVFKASEIFRRQVNHAQPGTPGRAPPYYITISGSGGPAGPG